MSEKLDVEVIDDPEFIALARLWFKERSDLALLAAFEFCRARRVMPPEWLFLEIGTLASNGISNAEWKRLKANRSDFDMCGAVSAIRFSDEWGDLPSLVHNGRTVDLSSKENVGDVFVRAERLLKKCRIHKDAETIKKAWQRLNRGMSNPTGAHQHSVMKWLWRFRG